MFDHGRQLAVKYNKCIISNSDTKYHLPINKNSPKKAFFKCLVHRHLLAKSTLAENGTYTVTLFSYNIVVSRARAATYEKNSLKLDLRQKAIKKSPNFLRKDVSLARLHSKFSSVQPTPNKCMFTQFLCKAEKYTLEV